MGAAIVLIGLLAALVVFVALSRQAVLQGRAMHALRTFYLLLFPPNDLYRPLVEVSVEVANTGTYSAELTNRYAGRYVFALEVAAPIEMATKGYTYDGHLTIKVYQGEQEIFSLGPALNLIPYWSATAAGFILAHYEVPRDIPQGTQLRCVISVDQGAPAFAKKYGPVKFRIVKVSEK